MSDAPDTCVECGLDTEGHKVEVSWGTLCLECAKAVEEAQQSDINEQ
jgi:hypothetical protein